VTLSLRTYQARAIDELWAWFAEHADGNPIVDASVGAGKSIMIAAVCQRAGAEFVGTRILVLQPQKELLQQNLQKLVSVWPDVDVGVYSASVGRKQLGRQVTYATIDSVYKRGLELGRVDMIMVDECHLIPTKDSGKWRRLLADIRKHSPHARVIGWTGTPFRGNGVWLTAGESPVFTHIASRVPMSELLGLGYLAPLVPATTAMRIEAADVRLSGDDYVVSELAKAVDKSELTEAACDEIVRLGASRRAWLVFCVTVEHAVHVSQALQRRGISCGVVTGETPKETREILIASLRAGKLRALVNVAVLTTGFDAPVVDAIFLLRPTKSPVLYNQIAGRGMRVLGANIEESTRNGKANCLWADFTDTTATQGPVDKLTGRMPAAKGAAIAPFKLCPKCGSQNPTGRLVCICCGHQFPPPDRVVHGLEASSAAVLSGQSAGKFKEVKVDSVIYQRHQKPDAPDSVRVEYRNGLVTVAREWLAFSAQYQVPRRKAEQWWIERAKIDAIPGSTDDALEWLAYDKSILKTPTSLLLNTAGKYDDIVEYRFADDHEPAAAAATESLA
jgi:DNA repair protein RadD